MAVAGRLRHLMMVTMDDGDAEIYEKYADELIRFATALAGPSSARDVLADSVLRVFTSPSWKSVANKRAYLYRAVLNEARQRKRSLDRRLRYEMTVGSPSTDREEEIVGRADLARALCRLTVRQRAVVFQTYWLELDAREIAGDLHLSERTVQRELARARTRLKELLG